MPPDDPPRRSLILAAAILVAAAWLAVVRCRAPSDPAEFALDRAVAHLHVVARRPHPYGSPANRAVRAYIERELRAYGLDVELQRATVRVPRSALELEPVNVIARMRGTRGTDGRGGRALMLACHYDSVRTGPGAGDDGAAVAALLETARAFTAGPRPRNDVIVLFTDAEELGLLGARAFVERHPWAADVTVVLNFEARGIQGPAVLFETGAGGNAWLVDQYARVAPRPVTTSLAADVYRRMPNATDLSVFKAAGMPGLNFAFIGGYHRYHTPADDVAHLSRASLTHHGLTMLRLGRHLADADLGAARAPGDAVFFDVLAAAVVRYPVAWALPLAVVAGAGVAALAWRGVRSGQARPLRVVAAAGWVVLAISATAGAVAGGTRLIGAARVDPVAGAYTAGTAVVAVLLTAAGIAAARRWATAIELATGAMSTIAGLGLFVAVYVPGGSYLLAWPTLFAAASVVAACTGARPVTLALLHVPTVIVWSPAVLLFGQALTMRMAGAVAALVALVAWIVLPTFGVTRADRT